MCSYELLKKKLSMETRKKGRREYHGVPVPFMNFEAEPIILRGQLATHVSERNSHIVTVILSKHPSPQMNLLFL